jgi:hypothetical protein
VNHAARDSTSVEMRVLGRTIQRGVGAKILDALTTPTTPANLHLKFEGMVHSLGARNFK